MTVHAEAFAGGAEQCQQHDREGVQEKKPVAPLRVGDAKNAQARECQVLCVRLIGSMLPERSKDDDNFKRTAGRVAEGLQAA